MGLLQQQKTLTELDLSETQDFLIGQANWAVAVSVRWSAVQVNSFTFFSPNLIPFFILELNFGFSGLSSFLN
jgi:hypothetical protein